MQPLTFSEFRQRVAPLYCLPMRAPATARQMDYVLGQVAQLGVATTADITTELAARYVVMRSAKVCANTVRGELGYLRAAANLAVEEDWLDRSPRWRRVWPRASEPRLKRVHSIAEIARVLQYLRHRAGADWIDHRTYVLTSLVAHTGVRLREATYALQDDFDLRVGIFTVREHRRLKTWGSAAPVPLCQDVVVDLACFFGRTASRYALPRRTLDGPWTAGSQAGRPTGRLVAAGTAVGVAGFTCHSLRHTFATHFRRRFGGSARQLRDILRHRAAETQEHYVHPEVEREQLVASVRHVRYR